MQCRQTPKLSNSSGQPQVSTTGTSLVIARLELPKIVPQFSSERCPLNHKGKAKAIPGDTRSALLCGHNTVWPIWEHLHQIQEAQAGATIGPWDWSSSGRSRDVDECCSQAADGRPPRGRCLHQRGWQLPWLHSLQKNLAAVREVFHMV